MKLTDTGESRIRGYLYVLERSLRSFLPPAVAADAVREVESHIRDSVILAGDVPDERVALEGILERLGPPDPVDDPLAIQVGERMHGAEADPVPRIENRCGFLKSTPDERRQHLGMRYAVPTLPM